MLQWFLDLPLVGSGAAAIYLCCSAFTAAVLLGALRRRRMWSSALGCLITGAVAALASWWVLERVWQPFPDAVPWSIYAAGGVTVAALVAVCIQAGRRRIAALAVVTGLVGTAGALNNAYALYPTVRSLNPSQASVAMTYAEFQATTQAPTAEGRVVGATVTMDLDNTASGFSARSAIAYIPPAYWEDPSVDLPVIVLLAGNPGSPTDWFDYADAAAIADAYQVAHDGYAPIVVSVDGTGSYTANPACVDGPDNKVMTYLATDVPAALKAAFRVDQNQSHWTIGGLSYGGTCSLQIITNCPEAYGTFLDFSGQAHPVLGSHEETVDTLFGGSEEAFNEVDPEYLLTEAITDGDDRYTTIAGKFIAGESDEESVTALQHLAELADDAGMDVEFSTVSGGHDFLTWRIALQTTFSWAAQRGGLGEEE